MAPLSFSALSCQLSVVSSPLLRQKQCCPQAGGTAHHSSLIAHHLIPHPPVPQHVRRRQADRFVGQVLDVIDQMPDVLGPHLLGDNEVATNVYRNVETTPRIALSFSIPIWDWGENKARMEASDANLKIDEVDLEVQQNDIIVSIRKVYRNLQNLETQIVLAEQNVVNAEITYEINLERYKNGDLTSFDLGRFQNQLSSKKTAQADALINYKMELLNLKILSLYDFENQEPVITSFN